MKKINVVRICISVLLSLSFLLGSLSIGEAKTMRYAMLVKNLGNGFFEAARDGGKEAAKEIGNIELIYTGPTSATAEGQIAIINSLIAQKVDAIMISANDPDALLPVVKKARRRKIKVLSFDSTLSAKDKGIRLLPSSPSFIGKIQIQMASQDIGGSGEIAVLSATSQATNQNIWIKEMKSVLAKDSKYSGLKLVSVVYGDDQSEKSYREALGLFKSYPNLKAIIAPTTVGIASSAKAVEDQNLIGKIFVSGLGLPSEMLGHVKSGAVKNFALWNPIDLGYTATYLADALVKRKARGRGRKETISAGRMGKIQVKRGGEAIMGEPYIFNASNIDKFSKIY